MAKLRGAQKRAFLRRMARGRAAKARRHGRGGHVRQRAHRRTKRRQSYVGTLRPSRRRPGVIRLAFHRNPMSALIANPSFGYTPAYAAGYERTFGRKPRRRRKGARTMAKRRRKRRHARRAAPRSHRRRRRGYAGRRIRRAIRVPRRYAHRYYKPRGKRRVYLNPRRRRIRRRRNPGMRGSLVKRVLVPYAAGFIASGAIAVLDTGLANYPMVKNLVKVGAAFFIAFAGRRYPTASVAAIASLAGSQGYALGTKLAGGFIAQTPAQAVKGLGEMSRSYPEMGALLTGGVGALLNGMGDPSNPDSVVMNYNTALQNMAESDDD